MCLAIPGKIESIKGDTAIIDFNGVKKEANICLVAGLAKGDYVIVHAGFAINKLTDEDAFSVFKLLNDGQKS